jgi:hypothetical protein
MQRMTAHGEGWKTATLGDMGDGPGFRKVRKELGPGGFAHVEAATQRKVKSVGDEDAVYVVVGGKGGYVGRDGRAPEDTPRVQPGS